MARGAGGVPRQRPDVVANFGRVEHVEVIESFPAAEPSTAFATPTSNSVTTSDTSPKIDRQKLLQRATPSQPETGVAASTPQLPAVFSSTPISHSSSGSAGSGAPSLATGTTTAVLRPSLRAATSLAGAYAYEGETYLATWMGDPSHLASSANAKNTSGDKPMPGEGVSASHGDSLALENRVISAITAPLTSLAGTGQVLYRFAKFDPITTFADALTEFARESASIPHVAVADQHSHRAWKITGLVIGIDLLIATRWCLQYSMRRKMTTAHVAAPSI